MKIVEIRPHPTRQSYLIRTDDGQEREFTKEELRDGQLFGKRQPRRMREALDALKPKETP